MSGLFPVLLKIADRRCVVIGGGEVALRKAATLVERDGRVAVISPQLCPELKALSDKGRIEWEAREYRPGDLAGAFLAVAAADDPRVNAAVREEAEKGGVLANLADDPEGSDYQAPSFFEQGPLLITVSTRGLSPAVSRALRRMIQAWLGGSFAEALALLREFRERVKTEIPDAKRRVKFWEEAITPETLEKVRAGDLEGFKQSLDDALEKGAGLK